MQPYEAYTINVTAWQQGDYRQDEFPAIAIFRMQASASLPKLTIFPDKAPYSCQSLLGEKPALEAWMELNG